jgi:flagella basal body P-ring formation protein FlgA
MEAMMRRIAILTLVLACGGAAAAQTLDPGASLAPVLKRQATVAGEIVRIGDLIDNAGAVAGTAIFRAPDLGETGTVEAYRVLDAVRRHGLVAVESQGIAEVIVTRPGRIIVAKDVEAAIGRVLAARYGLGDGRNLAFTFDHEAKPVHLEQGGAAELQPTRILYDRGTGRFDLTFEVPGSALMHGMQLRYTGSAVETRDVAVLTRQLARGEVVKQADVTMERRPRAELSDDMPDTANQVVGLAARRPLRAGQALRSADLTKAEVVLRGDPVTLIYEVPGVFLTIRGKALESGAEGDLVSVVNGQSKRTLQGTVSGPGRVTISATLPRSDPTTVSSVPPRGRTE